MNVIDELDAKLKEMLASREVFDKHFTKADLGDYIDMLINSHRIVITATQSFKPKHMRQLSDKLTSAATAKKEGFGPYIDYRKRLTKVAMGSEMKATMSSLLDANDDYIKLLSAIKTNLDDYFGKKPINMLNMRISHVMLIGVLYQSEQLATFTKYMYTLVAFANGGRIKELPKYRSVYITDHAQKVAAMVSALANGAGAKDIKGMVKNIKINAADFTLISPDVKVQVKRAGDLKLSNDSSRMMTAGIAGIPGIRSLGEHINTIISNFKRNKSTEEEWIKSHTALLIMQLENTDKDSPEYVKLEKIIARYEAIINKNERKRNKG